MKKNNHIRIGILSILVVAFIVLCAGVVWYVQRAPIVVNEYVLKLRDEKGKVAEFEYGSLPSLTNSDYYKNVREQLVTVGADFVDADLALMKLAVYKKGQRVLEVKIGAKGEPGSWFETPAGLYKADAKQKLHYSSFEPVNMKWNIPFQGNYFIHGWPRFNKTDKPVTSDYSAGCIRLTDEDAKKVYDLVDVGMPILVHEDRTLVQAFDYNINIPDIAGKTYLAADITNNFVFLQKNQGYSYPMGDFAKLIQAFIVSEYMSFDRKITITESMLATTTKPRLKAKETYTPYDLIFPLLVEGSNEAAAALAAPLGESYVLKLMNTKAKALGMESTSMVSISGVSSADVTTASDMFQLAKAIGQYRTFILDITRDAQTAMIYGPIQFTTLTSNNPFRAVPGYVGGMVTRGNGDTKSAVEIFSTEFKGQKRLIALMSFDTNRPEGDILSLRDYVTRTYK